VEGPGASLLEGPNPSAAHHCSGARHLNYAIIRLIWPLCGLLWSLYLDLNVTTQRAHETE
jgi:hypothetical protein